MKTVIRRTFALLSIASKSKESTMSIWFHITQILKY